MGPRPVSPVHDVRVGVPGTGEVRPGAHWCALYSGPAERDRLLTSFMEAGMRDGDQCVSFIDDLAPPEAPRPTHRVPVLADARRWHLGAYPSPDARLSSGELSVEQLSLRVTTTHSSQGRSSLVRAAGEISSVSRQSGAKRMSAYECGVTAVLAVLPALFLCMYDVDRLERGMLVEVMKIHSTVVLDGAVLHNRHSVVPETYPESYPETGPGPGARRLSPQSHTGRVVETDQWLSLTRAELRIAQHVARGMTNRATADVLILSPHTVDAHLKHMYLKLGIHSRVELAVLALRHGRP